MVATIKRVDNDRQADLQALNCWYKVSMSHGIDGILKIVRWLSAALIKRSGVAADSRRWHNA